MTTLIKIILLSLLLTWPSLSWALPPGTLLYRTSSSGKMYGYSSDPLITTKKGIMTGIYPGHVGIYVGQENGIDYVVETLANGVVKTKAKNFVNLAQGEELIGAKIPIKLSPIQVAKVVMLAKSLATKQLAYDFDFRKQKGPGSGDWTCVGLTEKIYESANISNPNNIGALEYDPQYYAVDITPDGFDNKSVVNSQGDVFSRELEFSKIARRKHTLIPAPELIGYNAGLEHQGERYIFLPYTQFLQPSLKDVDIDIPLSSRFSDSELRGSISKLGIMLKWSLINNPLSSLKNLAWRAQKTISAWQDKIFSPTAVSKIAFETGPNKTKKSSSRKAKSHSNRHKKKKTSAAVKKIRPTQARVMVKQNRRPLRTKKIEKGKTEVAPGLTKTDPIKKVVAEPEIKLADSLKLEKGIKINFNYQAKQDPKTNLVPVKKVSNIIVQKKEPINTPPQSSASPSYSNVSVHTGTNNSNSSNDLTPETNNGSNATTSDTSEVATSTNTTTDSETDLASSTNEIATSTTDTEVETEPDYPKLALINRVYATANNDWLELYNPGDYDFDLATANYRLEKAKTAEDPALALRIGNLDDASYPGGTWIKAHSYYMIVRDDADPEYLDQADAIVNRTEFAWFNSGYTFYLGTAAISSSTDVDIIDALGFGADASYFAGSNPAPAIPDYYVLTRIATTSDNSLDYDLVATDRVTTTTSTSVPPSEDTELEAGSIVDAGGIKSDQTAYLQHFDDCLGPGRWAVGKWGCAQESGYTYEPIEISLEPAVETNNFSLSFYYRKSRPSPRIEFTLSQGDNNVISVAIENGLFQFSGLPTTSNRYYTDFSITDNWDQLTLVIDKVDSYWVLYINGVEKYRQVFDEADLAPVDKLEISGDMDSFLVDELVLWSRALATTEVLANYRADLPFYPLTIRPEQARAQIIHAWNFNEAEGLVAKDTVAGADLELPTELWTDAGHSGSALVSQELSDLEANFSQAIESKDFSLDFWWRNQSYPGENGLKISLNDGNKDRLALIVDYYRPAFFFNANYGIISQGADKTIPNDDAWHYLALTYDSYQYKLRFYVDGQEKYSLPFIGVDPANNPDRISIKTVNQKSLIDDLRVWQGTLSADKIKAIYTASQ